MSPTGGQPLARLFIILGQLGLGDSRLTYLCFGEVMSDMSGASGLRT